jgi:hypothetical protein
MIGFRESRGVASLPTIHSIDYRIADRGGIHGPGTWNYGWRIARQLKGTSCFVKIGRLFPKERIRAEPILATGLEVFQEIWYNVN